MHLQEVSDDGKFVSYSLNYPSGLDTLFVMDNNGKRILSFPKGTRGQFHESRFTCLGKGRKLATGRLDSRAVSEMENVDEFQVLEGGNLLLVRDDWKTLDMETPDGKPLFHLGDVAAYSISRGSDRIGVSAEGGTRVCVVEANGPKIISFPH